MKLRVRASNLISLRIQVPPLPASCAEVLRYIVIGYTVIGFTVNAAAWLFRDSAQLERSQKAGFGRNQTVVNRIIVVKPSPTRSGQIQGAAILLRLERTVTAEG
jgi:hypothetical protein